MVTRRRGTLQDLAHESDEASEHQDCWEGANEATSSSLQSFVKSLANPQRSTALVIALSFMAVGVQAWEEEVLLSRMLLFLGVLLIPAAVGQPSAAAEVLEVADLSEVARTQPKLAEVPPALTMELDLETPPCPPV
ncbi:unnamed protein product [Durusdinium trenchii]|uniref:Uncharacterized protein n=2 Tax=Durusdinium trenchii TaxID=1381693 RepID=A0ABP0IR59_9DINO